MKHDATPPSRRPKLRLIETASRDVPSPEPKWSGRRRIAVMIGLGVLMWCGVAGAVWLLTRALT